MYLPTRRSFTRPQCVKIERKVWHSAAQRTKMRYIRQAHKSFQCTDNHICPCFELASSHCRSYKPAWKIKGHFHCLQPPFMRKAARRVAPCVSFFIVFLISFSLLKSGVKCTMHPTTHPQRLHYTKWSGKAQLASSMDLVIIRGMWNGPLKRLPFAGCATVPSRCR